MGAVAVLAGAGWLAVGLGSDGYWPVAALVVASGAVAALAIVRSTWPALRWLTPTVLFLAVAIAYPAIYTVYVAFTNFSTDHPVPRERAVEIIETAPAYEVQKSGSSQYRYTVYAGDDFALWLNDGASTLVALPDENVVPIFEAFDSGALTAPDQLPQPLIEPSEFTVGDEISSPAATVTIVDLDVSDTTSQRLDADLAYDPDQRVLVDARDAVEGARPRLRSALAFGDADAPTFWVLEHATTYIVNLDGTEEEIGLPGEIGGREPLSAVQALDPDVTRQLRAATYLDGDTEIKLSRADPGLAGRFIQRYVFETESGQFRDVVTEARYGTVDGEYRLLDPGTATVADVLPSLKPGFVSFVGWENFRRLNTSGERGNLLSLLVWSAVFSVAGLAVAFLLGLAAAILLNDPRTPLRNLSRALLILPYAMPAFLVVTLWRFFFNPNFGPINSLLESVPFAPQIDWLTNGNAARVAITIVVVWMFFPYFMIVSSGALKSIPNELYSAAAIDGAGGWHRYRYITLPLVFSATGPIVIATLAFFFTNITVIKLFLGGGPSRPRAASPVGYTDTLASYAYEQAFPTLGPSNYGYAAAVSLFVFLLIGGLAFVQARLSRRQEVTS